MKTARVPHHVTTTTNLAEGERREEVRGVRGRRLCFLGRTKVQEATAKERAASRFPASFFSPSFWLAIAGHVGAFTWLGRGTTGSHLAHGKTHRRMVGRSLPHELYLDKIKGGFRYSAVRAPLLINFWRTNRIHQFRRERINLITN